VRELASPTGRVRLRVGDCRFHTTRSILTQWPESRLAQLVTAGSEEYLGPASEEDFDFVIDRDGAHFQTILLWLRTGELDGPLPDEERVWLTREAEWYRMDQLTLALDPPPDRRPVVSEFHSDGANHLDVGADVLGIDPDQSFTLSLWVTLRALGSGTCALVHREGSAAGEGFPCLVLENGALRLQRSASTAAAPEAAGPSPDAPPAAAGSFEEAEFDDAASGASSSSDAPRLEVGRPHHVALTCDPSARRCAVYLDGRLCAAAALPPPSHPFGSGALRFGASAPGRADGVAGVLSDVCLEAGTLDAAGAQARAERALGLPPRDGGGWPRGRREHGAGVGGVTGLYYTEEAPGRAIVPLTPHSDPPDPRPDAQVSVAPHPTGLPRRPSSPNAVL
jgi:hypothetical protein